LSNSKIWKIYSVWLKFTFKNPSAFVVLFNKILFKGNMCLSSHGIQHYLINDAGVCRIAFIIYGVKRVTTVIKWQDITLVHTLYFRALHSGVGCTDICLATSLTWYFLTAVTDSSITYTGASRYIHCTAYRQEKLIPCITKTHSKS
jgi:hypothetical protein